MISFKWPKRKARVSDPVTSHEAAASVSHVSQTQKLILSILDAYGPLPDERIAEFWEGLHFPAISRSGLRSRRSELVEMGLVECTGTTVELRTGRRGLVWRITASGWQAVQD